MALTTLGIGRWIDGALLTNPTAGQVLVDTGVLTVGWYLIAIAGSASVDVVYDFQHRDIANGANEAVQRRRFAAGNEDFLFPSKIHVREGERIRAVLVTTITGELQLSIFALEVPASP